MFTQLKLWLIDAKRWLNYRLIRTSVYESFDETMLKFLSLAWKKLTFNILFQSFVHISTAYVHCYRTHINEIIYPMKTDPTVLLECLECFNDKIFDVLSQKLTKKYPNTYVYTKSLAE